MSYPPFHPGSGNHPYPPHMSYPSAPGYQQQTPYPPSGGYAPYPPSNTPYPSSGQAPYPPSGPSPYPPSGAPYPPAGNTMYPPSNQPAPYPPSGAPGGYPPAPYPPSGTPGYPPGGASYQPAPTYPPAGGVPVFPPGNSGSIYPTLAPAPVSHGQHYGSQHVQQRNPTVHPFSPFNPKSDAEILRKAMKGFGTDEGAIINVLARRTNQQRQEIARQFKSLYGKDLIKDLKGETSGNFEDLIVALMTPIHEFYAKELHRAISGLGTQEHVLIEVMCTLTNNEIEAIKSTYGGLYNTSLERDIVSDTSASFKRLLVSLCTARRDESMHVDHGAAAADARALYQAGEKKLGTDESCFNAILVSRNFSQLVAIFDEYQKLTGHPIEKAIQSEFSGYIEDGLMAIVKCARSRPGFLAECLHDSMSGAGTKDSTLIRIMATRCEIDLADIKQAYQARYGKPLEAKIKGDTSGDYKRLLIALQA